MKTRNVSRSITVGAACLTIPLFFANLSSAAPPNYDIDDLLVTMPYPKAWKYQEDTPVTLEHLTFVEPYGDYNGDGFADFLVGTKADDEDFIDGFVRLLSGKDKTVLFSFEADPNMDGQHAYAWPVAGDINGDGLPDVAIGVTYYDDEDPDPVDDQVGAVLVFLTSTEMGRFGSVGTTTLAFAAADVEIEGQDHSDAEHGQFGYNLALVDLDGNGLKDLVVGEWLHSESTANADTQLGAFYVYSSCELTPGAAYLADVAHQIAIGEDCRNQFSLCMDALGDDRVVMGAAQWWQDVDDQMELFGRVYVYKYTGGGCTPFVKMFDKTKFTEVVVANPETVPLTLPDDCTGGGFHNRGPDQDFGHRTAAAGDFDNDGDIDLLVGARFRDKAWLMEYTPGTRGNPDTYVQYGEDYDDPAANDTDPNTIGNSFGTKVGFIGDIDGDGYDDFAISDPGWQVNAEQRIDRFGRVYVYSGRTAYEDETVQPLPIFTITGEQSNAGFGQGSGHVGDINHDGVPDLGISARKFDIGPPPLIKKAGVVYGVFTPTELASSVTVDTGTFKSGAIDPELQSSNDQYYVVDSAPIFTTHKTVIDVVFDVAAPNDRVDWVGVTFESKLVAAMGLPEGEAFIKNGLGEFETLGTWTPSGNDTLEKIFERQDNGYVDGNGKITVRLEHRNILSSFTSSYDKVTLVVSRTPPDP